MQSQIYRNHPVEQSISTLGANVCKAISGDSLLAELRVNRQRLHRLAEDANDEGDITAERKIREEINRSLDLERRLMEGSISVQEWDDEIEQLVNP